MIFGDNYGIDTGDDGDIDGVDDAGGVDTGGDDGVGLVVFLSWHPLLLIECSSCD